MKSKLLCLLLLISLNISLFMQSTPVNAADAIKVKAETDESLSAFNYSDYDNKFKDITLASDEIILNKNNITASDNLQVKLIDNKEAIMTGEEGSVSFVFDVAAEGRYSINIEYYPLAGRGSQIERSIKIDGKIPFEEAGDVTLFRIYKDAVAYNNGFKFDSKGNEIRPQQIEAPMWTNTYIKDISGFYTKPFLFYLSKGRHTLTFDSLKEPLAISQIKLDKGPAVKSYNEIKKEYTDKGYKEIDGDKIFLTQAENAYLKSDATLYPIYDRSSAGTQPFNPEKILLNTIGSYKWFNPGQWISWKINVPKAGLYRLGVRERQNQVSGQFVNRRLYVNDEVPFSEADNLTFSYNGNWDTRVFGDKSGDYLFYLNEGDNTVKMEVTLGAYSEIISSVEESIFNLNYVYRQILMITGPSPDPYRDYKLGTELPECMEILKKEDQKLRSIIEKIVKLTGNKGTYTSSLEKICNCIENMLKDTDRIPSRFENYKQNLVSLGAWVLSAKEQPLELDYIMALPKGAKTPADDVDIITGFLTSFKMFISTFFHDYSSIGENKSDRETINIWLTSNINNNTGRDQANVLIELINNTFVPQHNIGVKLKLVAVGSLLPAVLAGKGPDINLTAGQNEPMDYAMRGAVRKLNDFPGFDEVVSRFDKSAMVPFTFNGNVYALPETQSFQVLYYRKDILSELGITKLKTWQDIINMLPELQKKNMEFGMPSLVPQQLNAPNGVYRLDLQSYWIFLFQNGGQLYSKDAKKVVLDNDVGVSSFKQWTNYYTNYKLPLVYDFGTRFRMGDMPVGIADFTYVNRLAIFAPEIKGLWGITLIPGTVKSDGTIDHSVASGGLATEMLATTKKPDEAWKFMSWWCSTDTQHKYGIELESLMGESARYPAANLEAFKKIPWAPEYAKVISEQRKYVKGIPEVPGGYLKEREIDFAFKAVINYADDPRESLIDHIDNINMEIEKKRKEFGIN